MMIKWAPSRAGLCLLFLFLGLLVLLFDRHTYKRYSGAEIAFSNKATPAVAGTAVQATIKELSSKLVKPEVKAGRYAVTVDKNLFAADRKAWQAPYSAPAETEKKDEATAPARRDVVLYGTYLVGPVKKAMLHFKRFRKGRMLLAEGEEAKDQDGDASGRRRAPVYTVLKVEAKKVILRDERGGEFEVGLYDNKQRKPAETKNKRNIQVESAVVPQPVTTAQPASATVKGTAATLPFLSAKQIRKLSVEEKNALVERGDLVKHDTPFGPVYKRARKK